MVKRNVMVAERLPELNQEEFPEIPTPPKPDMQVMITTDALKTAEEEEILGVFLSEAIHKGKWVPIHVKSLTTSPLFGKMGRAIIHARWKLADKEMIEIFDLEDGEYLLPKPAFADLIRRCKLKYLSQK